MPCHLKFTAHTRSTLISAFYPLIRVYPHIRVLPSYPCFTLISVFYPHIRVLPSRLSVRPSVHPSVRLSIRPSVRVLHFHPYPRFTLTRFLFNNCCREILI